MRDLKKLLKIYHKKLSKLYDEIEIIETNLINKTEAENPESSGRLCLDYVSEDAWRVGKTMDTVIELIEILSKDKLLTLNCSYKLNKE